MQAVGFATQLFHLATLFVQITPPLGDCLANQDRFVKVVIMVDQGVTPRIFIRSAMLGMKRLLLIRRRQVLLLVSRRRGQLVIVRVVQDGGTNQSENENTSCIIIVTTG